MSFEGGRLELQINNYPVACESSVNFCSYSQTINLNSKFTLTISVVMFQNRVLCIDSGIFYLKAVLFPFILKGFSFERNYGNHASWVNPIPVPNDTPGNPGFFFEISRNFFFSKFSEIFFEIF